SPPPPAAPGADRSERRHATNTPEPSKLAEQHGGKPPILPRPPAARRYDAKPTHKSAASSTPPRRAQNPPPAPREIANSLLTPVPTKRIPHPMTENNAAPT